MKIIRVFIGALFCITSFSLSAQTEYAVSLAEQTGDTISRATIAANPVVMIAGTGIPVASFEFTYLNEEGDLISLAIKDKLLNSPALLVIANQAVNKVYIDNARFMLDGVEFIAKSKTIILRD